MLYLADLPLSIGAFHAFGTNGIVLNRKILKIMAKESESNKEFNLFIFSLLLHEYLHSLGYIDEIQVKELTYRIIKEIFGEDKNIIEIALKTPKLFLKSSKLSELVFPESEMEIVFNFEDPNQRYIS